MCQTQAKGTNINGDLVTMDKLAWKACFHALWLYDSMIWPLDPTLSFNELQLIWLKPQFHFHAHPSLTVLSVAYQESIQFCLEIYQRGWELQSHKYLRGIISSFTSCEWVTPYCISKQRPSFSFSHKEILQIYPVKSLQSHICLKVSHIAHRFNKNWFDSPPF